jgi:hypothetical protein
VAEVVSSNPYWRERGVTFEDPDGYRIVLENAAWSESEADDGADEAVLEWPSRDG